MLREVAAGPTFGVVGPEATAKRQRDLEVSGLPVLVEAAPHLARFSHDEEFEYMLDLIVNAVTRKADEGDPASSQPPLA